MIKLPALLFLFLVQFILICAGLAVFLFIRQKKLNTKMTISNGEIRRLESEIYRRNEELKIFSGWPEKYNEMRQKFEQVQAVNAKLKETVEALVPEAERSKEFRQLLADIDQQNKELSSCITNLENENAALTQSMQFFKKEVEGLSTKLFDSVKRVDHERALTEKKDLELKNETLNEELDKKTKEYEKLEKNYIYLEKEYNALYRNIKGEGPS